MATLKKFEGRKVIGTTIAITNAGDGLSEALKGEPRELHHGQEVMLVMEGVVAKVRHDPSKDDPDDLLRVHIIRAGTAAIVDGEQEAAVAKLIEAQREKNELRREADEGTQRLPIGDDDHETPLSKAEQELADKLKIPED